MFIPAFFSDPSTYGSNPVMDGDFDVCAAFFLAQVTFTDLGFFHQKWNSGWPMVKPDISTSVPSIAFLISP